MSLDLNENLGKIMEEAQKMQEQMQNAQNQLASMKVTGEAGAGLLTVTMNGKHDAVAARVNPTLLEEDVEMLQDLIVAAVNDAAQKIEKLAKDKISDIASGMKLPAGLGDMAGTEGGNA